MSRDRPRNRLATAILAGLCCVGFAVGAASAKGEKTVRAAQVQTVLDCRALTDGAKRLACFDAAVAAMAEAEVKGDLVTIDREQRREVRRQTFGLSLPALTLFDRGEKGEDADKITATVAEASKGANGRWLIQLDGGALWRQTDDTDLYKEPHKGSVAEVRRGALGSYFMKVDGDSAFRVHRDN
jgi:putative N-acetylmannosamine-6-phosphate epimerase